jgi:hypothetical protein
MRYSTFKTSIKMIHESRSFWSSISTRGRNHWICSPSHSYHCTIFFNNENSRKNASPVGSIIDCTTPSLNCSAINIQFIILNPFISCFSESLPLGTVVSRFFNSFLVRMDWIGSESFQKALFLWTQKYLWWVESGEWSALWFSRKIPFRLCGFSLRISISRPSEATKGSVNRSEGVKGSGSSLRLRLLLDLLDREGDDTGWPSGHFLLDLVGRTTKEKGSA